MTKATLKATWAIRIVAEARADAEVDEEAEQRGPDHHRRRGDVGEDHQVARAAARGTGSATGRSRPGVPSAVAIRVLSAAISSEWTSAVVRSGMSNEVRYQSRGEALPGEGQPSRGRLVEPVEDHHPDRDQRVEDHQR